MMMMTINRFVLIVVAALVLTCDLSSATACPSTIMIIPVNSTKIIFNSPNFPAKYPRPLSCKWLFTAADDSVINIHVLTFDVYPTIFCLKDVLDIFDGDSKFSPVMQTWCGTRSPYQTYQTSGPDARLTFQAVTYGDDHQGFEFEVWSEINHIPDIGEINLGPAHLVLVAVSVALLLVFFVIVLVLVRKQRAKNKLHFIDN